VGWIYDGLRLFAVDANFPRVLAEGAVEPDDRSRGRVRHALDERAFAHRAPCRQARRSGDIITHVVSLWPAETARKSQKTECRGAQQLVTNPRQRVNIELRF